MASGALDGNGIWLYGEDDERDTFSELLNIGQDATSDATGLILARLTALETAVTPTTVGTPFTAATGFTLSVNLGIKVGKIAVFQANWTRTGGNISAGADGNVANTVIATFQSGWVPDSGTLHPASSLGLAAAYYASSTGLIISAVDPGGTLNTGMTGAVTGVIVVA